MHVERRLRIAVGVLACIGLAIAAYLTVVRLRGDSPTCVVGGSCAAVQSSAYAELAGIPVPVLGLLGYGALLLSSLLAGNAGRLLGLFAGIVGVGFSLWLTYVELWVIDAICTWCVISAIVVAAAATCATWRAVR